MALTYDAQRAIERARVYAAQYRKDVVQASDLLISLSFDKDIARLLADMLSDASVVLEKIRQASLFQEVMNEKGGSPLTNFSFVDHVMSRSEQVARFSNRPSVSSRMLLYALLSENSTEVDEILDKAGVRRDALREYIMLIENFVPLPKESASIQERNPLTDVSVSEMPHQRPAPVRVAESGGRLVQISELASPIDADELDFDRWRAPVAASIRDLLDDDLGPGTNHSRLRKRLLALAGSIDDVKANQFRLGYAIESLGVIVGAYRDAADDMPTLNAAVFGDVDHLHIQLMLGQSKLVAWRRFQRDADDDELHEGTADAGAVGASLDAAAAVLEGDAAAPIVDPELPRSFRWIRAAIADPAGTTRRMVYGAVKSLENVVSFLGQIALRNVRATVEAVGTGISKAVAAGLLFALADAALSLSGALPNQWVWLRPLLEAAAKVLHG